MPIDPFQLIKQFGLISNQVDQNELNVVLQELLRTKDVPGAVVEFGCYTGTTSLYIRRILNALGSDKEFHVYDSFEGLPEKRAEDQSPVGEQFKKGELLASKKGFLTNFHKAYLRPPFVHKGWFNALSPSEVPKPISFAFLDGDYYESIKVPLQLIENNLSTHATIVVDDYVNEALPGAARALDEWVSAKGLSITAVHSLGVIRL